MKVDDLYEYKRGWFIGDFEPSIIRTKNFEVGVLTHYRDEKWPNHIHKIATEINVLLEGKMIINGKCIFENNIFVIEPGEESLTEFLTDCKILVIKIPSVIGDKYEIV